MRVLLEESLSIYREHGEAGRYGLANALIRLGDMWRELGNYETASSLLEEGLRLMRDLNDLYGIVHALWQLGYHRISSGADRQAVEYFAEALPLSRQLVDQSITAVILSGLGEVAVRQGNFQEAAALEEESLTLRKEIGEKWGISVSLGNFAWIAIHQGEYEKAEKLLVESLTLRRNFLNWGGIAWCLEKLAKINLLYGQKKTQQPIPAFFQRAVRLFAAAHALRAPVGSVIDQADQPEYERDLATLRKRLGEELFSAHWQAGEFTPLDDILEEALAESARTSERSDKEKYVGLTARERNVAALIAESMSNREIANALTVEVKTIESHITHIFNKLGFDSRVQIAVWAVDKGLARPPQT
jgi:DNA-binding CsgD family transcriptional regulator